MEKKVISTDRAPEAIGPYSQAIAVGDHVFCSGQVALDPASGELVEGDVSSQARRCMENLGAVLKEAGTSFERVVKVTAYLVDMGDFAEFNEVYGEFFSADPPARVTVGVAGLPKGARVEVECIALV